MGRARMGQPEKTQSVLYAKQTKHRSESWRRAVASLPCACCMREGYTQAAHLNHREKGMSTKADDCLTIPLCVDCHREYDQGQKWTKAEKRLMGDEWLIQTLVQLARKELVKA